MGEYTAPICTNTGCFAEGEPLQPVTETVWQCSHCQQLYEMPFAFDTFKTEDPEEEA